MHDEFGKLAGEICHALNSKLSLAQLKKDVKGKTPVFDWAIGWLAREDKIVITPEKRGFLVQLKDTHGKAASG